ncbi:MAG: hypothetical protein Q4D14_01255 [Bacteroidales bacterium]|nr:hypothetical protein [Bacteroidales bacterium]
MIDRIVGAAVETKKPGLITRVVEYLRHLVGWDGTSIGRSRDERIERAISAYEDGLRSVMSANESGDTGINEGSGTKMALGDGLDTFRQRQQKAEASKGSVMPGLNGQEVKVVEIPRHVYTGNIQEATSQAISAARFKYVHVKKEDNILHYNNYGRSFDYIISGKAIKEVLNPEQISSSVNKGVHLSLAEHIDEVINNSIEVEEHPDYLKDDSGSRSRDKVSRNALMHRFYGVVNIDGSDYRVMTLMRENNNALDGNGVHAYEVQKIEVLDDDTPSTSNGDGSVALTRSGHYPLAKVLQNIEKSYDNGVKILDASLSEDSAFPTPPEYREGDDIVAYAKARHEWNDGGEPYTTVENSGVSKEAFDLSTKAVLTLAAKVPDVEVVTNQKAAPSGTGQSAMYSKKQKRALETASVISDETHQPTVVSSASGAKVLKEIETTKRKYVNLSNQTKTFLGDMAKALGATKHGSNSQYATFETKNGKIVTIRLSDHNGKVSTFDNHNEDEGISIVITAKGNKGAINDGKAHLVEYFYDAIKLRRADGKPLASIIESIEQSLYSGEFKDKTGLAERQELNKKPFIEMMRVFHGSAAAFDHFDSSHFMEGEGSMVYGAGHYVTNVKDTGKLYAIKAFRKNKARQELEYYKSRIDELNRLGMTKDKYPKMHEELEERINGLNQIKVSRYLYEVEIPDDNGSNYLSWNEKLTGEQKERIIDAIVEAQKSGEVRGTATWEELSEYEKNFYDSKDAYYSKVREHYAKRFNDVDTTGNEIYWILSSELGGNADASDYMAGRAEASNILSEASFTGIKVPTGNMTGGDGRGMNYVVFKDSDLKIVNRVEFLKNSDGVVYGWAEGNKIYLTPEGMNPNTPIHEYTHLWCRAVERKNGELWENVKSLIKDTPWWDEVMKDDGYADIRDDENRVASEVLSRLSGRKNAERFAKEAQKMLDEANGEAEKGRLQKLIDRVKEAVTKFWDWVGKDLFKLKKFGSIDEITDRVLYDLVDGTDLGAKGDVEGDVSLSSKPTYDENEIIGWDDASETVKFSLGDKIETFQEHQNNSVKNRGTVMPGLNEAEVRVTNVPPHTYKGNNVLTQARDAAIERYSKKDESGDRELLPQHYNNNGVEFYYTISPSSLKEAANHASNSDNIGVHIAVMDKLHEVINNSIEFEEHPDIKKVDGKRLWDNGYNNDVLMHRFVGAISIDGIVYKVKTTMKEYKDGMNGHYTYEVTKVEVLDDTPNTPHGRSNVSDVFVSAAKLLKDTEKSYDKGVKILDASLSEDSASHTLPEYSKSNGAKVKEGNERLAINGGEVVVESDKILKKGLSGGERYALSVPTVESVRSRGAVGPRDILARHFASTEDMVDNARREEDMQRYTNIIIDDMKDMIERLRERHARGQEYLFNKAADKAADKVRRGVEKAAWKSAQMEANWRKAVRIY